MSEKQSYCEGCRNDFYNKPGNSTSGHCWSLDNAKIVTRYRLGWWTRPDEPGAFKKVTTLSCHHEPGQFAFQESLPNFVTAEERKRIEGK